MKGGRFVRRSQSLPCEQYQHGDDQAGTFLYERDVDFKLPSPAEISCLQASPRVTAQTTHTHCRSLSPPRVPLCPSATFGGYAVAFKSFFHRPHKVFSRSH